MSKVLRHKAFRTFQPRADAKVVEWNERLSQLGLPEFDSPANLLVIAELTGLPRGDVEKMAPEEIVHHVDVWVAKQSFGLSRAHSSAPARALTAAADNSHDVTTRFDDFAIDDIQSAGDALEEAVRLAIHLCESLNANQCRCCGLLEWEPLDGRCIPMARMGATTTEENNCQWRNFTFSMEISAFLEEFEKRHGYRIEKNIVRIAAARPGAGWTAWYRAARWIEDFKRNAGRVKIRHDEDAVRYRDYSRDQILNLAPRPIDGCYIEHLPRSAIEGIQSDTAVAIRWMIERGVGATARIAVDSVRQKEGIEDGSPEIELQRREEMHSRERISSAAWRLVTETLGPDWSDFRERASDDGDALKFLIGSGFCEIRFDVSFTWTESDGSPVESSPRYFGATGIDAIGAVEQIAARDSALPASGKRAWSGYRILDAKLTATGLAFRESAAAGDVNEANLFEKLNRSQVEFAMSELRPPQGEASLSQFAATDSRQDDPMNDGIPHEREEVTGFLGLVVHRTFCRVRREGFDAVVDLLRKNHSWKLLIALIDARGKPMQGDVVAKLPSDGRRALRTCRVRVVAEVEAIGLSISGVGPDEWILEDSGSVTSDVTPA